MRDSEKIVKEREREREKAIYTRTTFDGIETSAQKHLHLSLIRLVPPTIVRPPLPTVHDTISQDESVGAASGSGRTATIRPRRPVSSFFHLPATGGSQGICIVPRVRHATSAKPSISNQRPLSAFVIVRSINR